MHNRFRIVQCVTKAAITPEVSVGVFASLRIIFSLSFCSTSSEETNERSFDDIGIITHLIIRNVTVSRNHKIINTYMHVLS